MFSSLSVVGSLNHSVTSTGWINPEAVPIAHATSSTLSTSFATMTVIDQSHFEERRAHLLPWILWKVVERYFGMAFGVLRDYGG